MTGFAAGIKMTNLDTMKAPG